MITLFNEEVNATSTNSVHNTLYVESFEEVFFGVYEFELNGSAVIAEEVAKYEGEPVVTIPVVDNGIKYEAPFILKKGIPMVEFNTANTVFVEKIIEEPDLNTVMETVKQSVGDNNNVNITYNVDKDDIIKELKESLEADRLSIIESLRNENSNTLEQIENIRDSIFVEFTTNSHNYREKESKDLKQYIENKLNDICHENNILVESSLQGDAKFASERDINRALSRVGSVKKELEDSKRQITKTIALAEERIKKHYAVQIREVEDAAVNNIRKEEILKVVIDSKAKILAELNNSHGLKKQLRFIAEEASNGLYDPVSSKRFQETVKRDLAKNFSAEMQQIKRMVASYGGGGGTNAKQYARGGVMNGNLNVEGTILSGGVDISSLFGEGGSGGSDVSSLSTNWEGTYTTVQANSASWSGGGGGTVTGSGTTGYIPAWSDSTTLTDSIILSTDGTTLNIGGDVYADSFNTTGVVSTSAISFETGTPGFAVSAGQLAWNPGEFTLDMGMNDNVTLQIGQEQVMHVKGGDDQTLRNGMAVYAGGVVGASSLIQVSAYSAHSDFVEELFLVGVATEDLTGGTEGFITTFGRVRGVDGDEYTSGGIRDDGTPAWSIGQILYASTSLSARGTLTSVIPVSPNRENPIAFVTKAPNQSNITLTVRANGAHGYHLNEMHDVAYETAPANGAVLSYNTSLSVWEPGLPASSGVTDVTGGDGIDSTGGTTPSIAVDATVVRTTGDQTIGGNKIFTGDTTIQGDLSVTGDFTSIATTVSVTSALSVTNHGTGPAIYAEQTGVSQPIAKFVDSEGGVIVFDDGGKLGIGTDAPAQALDVYGKIALSGRTAVYVPDGVFDGTSFYGNGGNDLVSFGSAHGKFNTATGIDALYNITAGSNNTATGYAALSANTSGCRNTATGSTALSSNTTGCQNTAAGYGAMISNTTGCNNVATGQHALCKNIDGDNNVAVGFQAMCDSITGINNTAVGACTLQTNINGKCNVAIGNCAMHLNTTGNTNVAVGNRALYTNAGGCDNVAVGSLALSNNSGGGNNVAIGAQALSQNSSGGFNVAIGSSALTGNTGCRNTAVGILSLATNSTGSRNTATGEYAMASNTIGANNTAIGSCALLTNETGGNNVAVGYQSQYLNITGCENVASGNGSLRELLSGNNNSAFGAYSLANNPIGCNNAAIGYAALSDVLSGGDNVAAGFDAGRYISDGTTALSATASSVFIGSCTKSGEEGSSNEIVIGHDVTGGGSNTVTIGNSLITETILQGNVGIGTDAPAEALTVSGNISASGAVRSTNIDTLTNNVSAVYSYLLQNFDSNTITIATSISDFVTSYPKTGIVTGDVVTISATNEVYILSDNDGSALTDWLEVNLKPNFLFYRQGLIDYSVVDTLPLSSINSSKYVIEVVDKSDSAVFYGEINVVSDGSIAVATEYALNHTSIFPFVEFGAEVVSGTHIQLSAVALEGKDMADFVFKGNRSNLFG